MSFLHCDMDHRHYLLTRQTERCCAPGLQHNAAHITLRVCKADLMLHTAGSKTDEVGTDFQVLWIHCPFGRPAPAQYGNASWPSLGAQPPSMAALMLGGKHQRGGTSCSSLR